ncbi:hypothetical protein SAMN06295943_2792 [Agreia sp. VKM Ac-1783]|nr:hypothetical protein SAMN06295943_2792 [Agreia sp. VKM Ac-1783]
MLAVGLNYVKSNGLSVGFDEFRLDDVISAAGVSRTTAYRLWDNKSSFVDDVLEEAAKFGSANLLISGDICSTLKLVDANRNLCATVEGRNRLLHLIVKVELENNYYATIDSAAWQSFLAISATLLGNVKPDMRVRLESCLCEGSAQFIDSMVDFYTELLRLLGFRLRAGRGSIRLFATLSSSIVEGLAVRHLSNPKITDSFYAVSAPACDEAEGWSPAAIGFLALFDYFVEPDPDFNFRRLIRGLDEYASGRT